MAALPKKPTPNAAELPDVERHDEVYFRHPSGAQVGKVLSRGGDGCWLDIAGKRHPMKWEDFLGHKVKVRPDARIVDRGEDGFIAESPSGHRRFVRDELGPAEPITKSHTPMVLLFGEPELLAKAGPIKNRPGLSLQDVTSKSGKPAKRWKRTGQKEPADAGAKHGYGTHDLRHGAKVRFKAGAFEGEGAVSGHAGAEGIHVKDSTGRLHRIQHAEITHHEPSPDATRPEHAPEVLGSQEPIPADKFNAADYGRSHNDPNVTSETILSNFPPDTANRIKEAQDRLEQIEQTIEAHRLSGEGDFAVYSDERMKLHKKILEEPWTDAQGKVHPPILSAEKIAAARPAPGKQPTFMMLGGRGGSGKSKFKGTVYDPSKFIVLDADAIKERMPEYEGWNAAQVHEESSDLLERTLTYARLNGLNVVLDATMKTASKAVDKVKQFQEDGYRIEAHYMHLPRQEAAKRAVERFLGETARLVPPDVVLGNTKNEEAFDQVRQLADKWSFRDNNVPRGKEPILISEGEKSPAVAAGHELAAR